MKVQHIETAIAAVLAENTGDIAVIRKLADAILVGDNYVGARARLAEKFAAIGSPEKAEKAAEKPAPKQAELPVEKAAPKARKSSAKTVKFVTHPLVREIDGVKCPCNTAAGAECSGKVLGNGFCATHGGKVDPNAPQVAKLRVK